MKGPLAFNLFLLAAAVYFVWSAIGYGPEARRIPLLVGVIVVVLQVWVTVKDAVREKLVNAVVDSGDERPPANEMAHVAAMCGWMFLFFVLIAIFGTLPAIFVVILLFLLMQREVYWATALALAASVPGAIWLLFVRLMHFELYPGVLFGGTLPPV